MSVPVPGDGIAWWYCCIDTPERTVLRQTCEGLVLTLFVGVPSVVWDAFWFVTAHDTAEYRSLFITLYGLEIVEIEVDGAPLSVVRPREGYLGYWVSWSVFVLLPDAVCPDGCQQSALPTP